MDPITIGSAAATGASMLMNSGANDSVQNARNRVLTDERNRQSQYDNNITALNTQSAQRFNGAPDKMGDRAKSVGDFYSANGGDVPASGATAGTTPGSTSNIVVQEGKRQLDKVKAFGGQQSDALANLRSFGDIFGEANRGVGQDAARIGVWNGFKQGSNSVLPLELETASHAGDGQKAFADILGGLGKVGMVAGLSGMGDGTIMNLFGRGDPVSSTVAGPTQLGFFPRLFG